MGSRSLELLISQHRFLIDTAQALKNTPVRPTTENFFKYTIPLKLPFTNMFHIQFIATNEVVGLTSNQHKTSAGNLT